MNLKEKLQKIVDIECQYADRDGTSTLSTCDHFGWDKDIWNYRHEIITAIRNRGYDVSSSVKWCVTDILTKTKIELK